MVIVIVHGYDKEYTAPIWSEEIYVDSIDIAEYKNDQKFVKDFFTKLKRQALARHDDDGTDYVIIHQIVKI